MKSSNSLLASISSIPNTHFTQYPDLRDADDDNIFRDRFEILTNLKEDTEIVMNRKKAAAKEAIEKVMAEMNNDVGDDCVDSDDSCFSESMKFESMNDSQGPRLPYAEHDVKKLFRSSPI